MNIKDIFKIKDGSEFTSELQEAICLNEDNLDILKLSNEERVFLLVLQAQGIIDNGGFQYFFESDFPNQPDYQLFVDAYINIGAKKSANAVKQALSIFPFDNPHKKNEERLKVLEEKEDDFEKLGKDILGNEDNYILLEEYARNNQDMIIQSITKRTAKKNIR